MDIVKEVELVRSQVNLPNKCAIDSVRFKAVEILKRAKPPQSNLAKAKNCVTKELKQYDDIAILNIDKDNNALVMEKLGCDEKFLGLLSDTATYCTK